MYLKWIKVKIKAFTRANVMFVFLYWGRLHDAIESLGKNW